MESDLSFPITLAPMATHVVIILTQWGKCNYSHLSDKEMELREV